MKTIAIINQKGGVGKSTTCNSLGAGLYKKGYKVLYIDLDAQGNLSYAMNATGKSVTTMELLTNENKASEAIVVTDQGDIIPSSPALGIADTVLSGKGKEYLLKKSLEEIQTDYDYILIDTPPSLSILTINALTACNSVIVPALADAYSLQGIGQLCQTIQAVKAYSNPDIKIDGILVTRYNPRTILTREVTGMLEETAKLLETKVFNTKIRENITIGESQLMKKDIFNYNPKCNATKDYNELINELIEG